VTKKRILLLFAHPAFHKSHANRHLLDAACGVEGVRIHDLYEEYPDFNIDIKREQGLLLEHDLIVFQHPFYWYSCPALLKEWLDLVLEHGFAYGHGGEALNGKYLLTATTTGGRAPAYARDGINYYSMREFLVPFERTAILCGMCYLPPFVVHGTRAIEGEDSLAQHAQNYADILTQLHNGTLDPETLDGTYINDILKGNETDV